MNMHFDKTVEDQILMTINNLVHGSVWNDDFIVRNLFLNYFCSNLQKYFLYILN
jgi:hypothetical protein